MSEEKKDAKAIPLPIGRTVDQMKEEVAGLQAQEQDRLQVLANNDPLWRDLKGRITALEWVLTGNQEDAPTKAQ